MTLTIEFFGIPRQRTGVAKCELTFAAETITLEQVLSELGRRFPAFADDCLRADHLMPGYAANLGGERFLSDPATVLHNGDELLILSADAGG